MFRLVAIALLAFGASTDCVAQGATEPVSDEQRAAARAREVLAEQLKTSADAVEVTRIEPKTWNDSSLGCGKPGSVAMQVITHGFAVALLASGREYTVHVSGENAVICGRVPVIRKNLRRATPARGLDLMMEQARQDLAARLQVQPEDIRVAGMKPHRWSDSAMDCPSTDEQIDPGPIAGYRISLKHQSRIYTYHTDMTTVRACPPIEKD